MLLPQVLVEGALEWEAFATDLTVEGLVVCVATDVILQLVFPGVLLATELANEGGDAHVQAHVAIQAALLVEALSTVDTNESLVVGVPLAVQAALAHVVLQSGGGRGHVAVFGAQFEMTEHSRWDGQRTLGSGPASSVAAENGAGRTGAAEVDEARGGQP